MHTITVFFSGTYEEFPSALTRSFRTWREAYRYARETMGSRRWEYGRKMVDGWRYIWFAREGEYPSRCAGSIGISERCGEVA